MDSALGPLLRTDAHPDEVRRMVDQILELLGLWDGGRVRDRFEQSAIWERQQTEPGEYIVTDVFEDDNETVFVTTLRRSYTRLARWTSCRPGSAKPTACENS